MERGLSDAQIDRAGERIETPVDWCHADTQIRRQEMPRSARTSESDHQQRTCKIGGEGHAALGPELVAQSSACGPLSQGRAGNCRARVRRRLLTRDLQAAQ